MEWSTDEKGYITFVVKGNNYTRQYSAHQLTEMFVKHLIGSYESRENVIVRKVAITCPARYRSGQRKLLKQAGMSNFHNNCHLD